MVRQRHISPHPVLDEQKLREALDKHGFNASHAAKIINYVIRSHGRLASWESIPHLPAGLYALLASTFTPCSAQVQTRRESQAGDTTKMLLRLQDGHAVESVVMRCSPSYGPRGQQGLRGGAPRATLCVSSQVGCSMGCSFCATGTMGLRANLTAGEIAEQMLLADAEQPIRNVVFMGMGEPLMNADAVRAAILLLLAPHGFRLSPHRVTVSTVGVVPRLLSFASSFPPVRLALSLHAPNQALRQSIVPAARAFPLPRLMAALAQYQRESGRRVFVEYVMLRGVNDGEETAQELGRLLKGRDVVVNLIPFNASSACSSFASSPPEAVAAFQRTLRSAFGLRTTVRREMGADVQGACGQLAGAEGGGEAEGGAGAEGKSERRGEQASSTGSREDTGQKREGEGAEAWGAGEAAQAEHRAVPAAAAPRLKVRLLADIEDLAAAWRTG